MPAGLASVPTEVSEPVSQDVIPESSDLGDNSEQLPLPRENEGDRVIENAHEDEDEDEDTDFNPFIRTNSPEASSSLSSEVENLDIDGADSTGRHTVVVAGISEGRQIVGMQGFHTSAQIDNCEGVAQSTASSIEDCGRKLDEASAGSRKKELALVSPSKNGSLCDEVTESVHLSDSTNVSAGRKSMVDMDNNDAISMRTRARYSLASFTLDELETFLQETDDEDDLQKVDDDEEYRKFLAAISRGDDIQNLHCNVNGDDEDEEEENDADFELELEEALESEPEDIEQRRTTRQIKRQKTAFDRGKKVSGQASRPLRPILPFSAMEPFSGFGGPQLSSNGSPSFALPLNNNFYGFTQHQIGQLHCLIYEHVQLLIQVFSICVFEPIKSNIAAEVKDLLLEILHQRDQVLTWRTVPYPNFFFTSPCISASVMDEGQGMLKPNCSKDSVMQSFPSGRHTHLPSDTISINSGRDTHLLDLQAGSTRTSECTPWAPYISGPVLSVLDVAPLRLVESYVNDVSSAVQAYERCQIELDFENPCPKEHLFPLHCTPCHTQSQGEIENNSPDCNVVLSSSSHDRMPKKTMAAVLIEKAKNQPVSLVPKDIATLAQRFCSLFNPALYPRKPPPAALTNRVLFTDAEDRLLALGLMEYNTDWKAIQQRFLPCKSRHQIFVRQKNRASSKAPENPIKAVRRIKNSPLNPEEIARIEVGLKKFKLDWVSIWRFFVPYRDPSLLPRQWRIASGTQKSYKSDANRKAKRRLCELRSKASKPSLSTLHSPSEKEGDSTDNAAEETNHWNKHADKEDEAYVHEAFLADWRSDNNGCAVIPTCLPPHEGFQPRAWMDNSVSRDIQFQKCSRFPAASTSSTQVYLRPYRARTPNGARLVKLAPDLPPVNLPPSVRVISQLAFKSSQPAASAHILGNISRVSSRVEENHTPHAAAAPVSGLDCSQKNSVKVAPSSRPASDPKVILDKHTPESGVADLQMHPLLFQPTQDGHLPYYSPNCRSSVPSPFTFVSGKQPELGLGLFHDGRHIKDAGSFLSTSSKSPERIAPPSGIVFHPLLQRTDDAEAGTARPPCSESRQKCALVQKNSTPVSNQVHDNHNNSSASGTIAGVPHCNSKLDLNIHPSGASLNQEVAEGRDLTQGRTGRLRAPAFDVAELKLANDLGRKNVSVPNEISNEIVSGDFELVAARYEGDTVSEDMRIAPLPEIIMEQEELSDSEEELEENVEFECEEMTDSEGDL